MPPLLEVSGLDVSAGPVPLVRGVSFTIGAGERVGLIGESGSGKTLTALSLLGLLPEGVRAAGDARLAGVDGNLVGAPERHLARFRGRVATMVFQEPMAALNPVQRVGDQVAEVMLLHRTRPGRQAAQRAAVELLARVQLPSPETLARAYPHQLSGGQRQRVMLAIALANDPQLLICDEPTTALDVTVQKQILDLVLALSAERGTALLFVTHDLAVVASVCQRVVVLYGGRVVEAGPVLEVFTRPRHPYTEGLLAASDLTATDERGRLRTIPGTVPDAGGFPSGCVFRDRCAYATGRCAAEPPLEGLEGDDRRAVACWHPRGGPDA
jgi:peptide/nickel transport system ATP-binding protein